MAQVKIIIVEDDAIISMDLEQRVKKYGAKIIGVFDRGDAVLKKVAAEKPDLVLMDINIKGNMDGVTVAGILKENFNVPVAFITAYSDAAMKERAKDVNPLGYLIKPIRETELVDMLDMAINQLKLE